MKNLNDAVQYYRFAMTDDEIEAFNELPQPLHKHICVLAFYADKFRQAQFLISDAEILLSMADSLYDDQPFGRDAEKLRVKLAQFIEKIEEKSGGKK